MITEDYVSFETAKPLKEKGYWNIAPMLYKENGDIVNYNVPLNNNGFSNTLGVFYEAPTLQMAMKWLREMHKIFLNINFIPEHFCFTYRIVHNGVEEKFVVYSATYEEACEAAIKYCLENLI